MNGTLADLVAMVSKGKGAKFGSLTYTAKGTGEKARHTLILGFDIEKLYLKDIDVLNGLIPTLEGIKLEAATAILKSRQKSLQVGIGNNPAYTQAGLWIHPEGLNGIRVHIVDGHLQMWGLQESKIVLEKGEYKTVVSKPLTLAKREIEKSLPSTRYRCFRFDHVHTAKMNGDVLELEGNAVPDFN